MEELVINEIKELNEELLSHQLSSACYILPVTFS